MIFIFQIIYESVLGNFQILFINLVIITVTLIFRYNTSEFVKQSNSFYCSLEKVKSEPNSVEKNKLASMFKWDQVIDFIDEDDNIVVDDTKPKTTSSDLKPILDMSSSFHQTDVLKPLKDSIAVKYSSASECEHIKSFDDTLIDETLDWRQRVSDDSFVKMEKLIMDEVEDIEFEKEHEKVIRLMKRQNSADILLKPDLTTIQESFDNSSQDSTAPKSTSFDDSLNFNDTLEEMEHLMKYGMEYILQNPKQEVVIERPVVDSDVEPYLVPDNSVTDPIKPPIENKPSVDRLTYLMPETSTKAHLKLETPAKVCLNVKTPTKGYLRPETLTKVFKNSPTCKSVGAKNYLYLNKESIKSPKVNLKPAANTTPFKVPTKPTPNSVEKRVFFPTPPSAKNKIITPSQYDNVLSPVQYYIKNSPVVPKIKNVSPGKNFWMREYERSVSKAGMQAPAKGKENSPLQQRAYKAAATTKLVSTPPSHRLPKNSRVGLMAESLPKPTVIKHKRREFFPSPPKNDVGMQSIEDSFANLKMHSGDVSVCVGKEAVRSHTLK